MTNKADNLLPTRTQTVGYLLQHMRSGLTDRMNVSQKKYV
jgi:hypothetical protein